MLRYACSFCLGKWIGMLKCVVLQVVINYANFLEENEYWEESFKVYERGVELFTYPIAFEIWNTYLSKFVKRYGGNKIERARDLFEQALKDCPEKFVKPIFLMYAALEEEHGLAKRAMGVLERATEKVALQDRFEVRGLLASPPHLLIFRLTLEVSRCTRTTLRRRQRTLGFQLHGLFINALSRRCPIARRPRCACGSQTWNRSSVRLIEREQVSTLTRSTSR